MHYRLHSITFRCYVRNIHVTDQKCFARHIIARSVPTVLRNGNIIVDLPRDLRDRVARRHALHPRTDRQSLAVVGASEQSNHLKRQNAIIYSDSLSFSTDSSTFRLCKRIESCLMSDILLVIISITHNIAVELIFLMM